MESISRHLLNFLLNSLWQVPLIALVATLVDRLLRRGPAAHRHLVWVAALIASVAVPLASTRRPAPPPQVRYAVRPDAATAPSGAAPTPSAALVGAIQTVRSFPLPRNTVAALLAAYAGLLLFCCLRFLAACRRTRRILSLAGPRPLAGDIWQRCLHAFGLSGVELRSSAGISVPVAAGIRARAVILPDSFFGETSEDVLATAIGHEMAHLARHDFLSKIVYEILYLPIAFQPAAWYIRRQIERTREMACDELVTRRLLDPEVYARSIVSIASSLAATPRAALALGIFDGGDILEERIRRLLDRPVANLRRARLLLIAGLSTLAVCAVIASGLAINARAQSAYRDELNLGVAAFKAADYTTAVQHFRAAVLADPSAVPPKLYLAAGLMAVYEPGNQSQAALATEIRQQLLNVLSLDNHNVSALGSLMMLAVNDKKFSEARDWAQKMIEADPKQTSAYYTIGFIDWSTAYPPYMAARAAAGMQPADPGIIPDASQRLNLAAKISSQIEEGVSMLQKALEIDPQYADAMAYTNLLYRIKAAIVDSPAESAALTAEADSWMQKTLDAKRSQPSRANEPGMFVKAPPPPPPPPPPPGASANAALPRGSYWQVSPPIPEIDGNQAIKMLRAKGFQSQIVEIVAGQDNFVRLVVGPYTDAESLAQAKTALEAAGFKPIRILGQ